MSIPVYCAVLEVLPVSKSNSISRYLYRVRILEGIVDVSVAYNLRTKSISLSCESIFELELIGKSDFISLIADFLPMD